MRDYLKMSHAQRAAVIRKAGVRPPYVEEAVARFDEDCGQARHHPEDLGDPLGSYGP